MVEMTPREQWTSFAPYYAPTNPGNMQHYIDVVTDTVSAKNIVRENGTAFPLTRKIPGTDLIWGSMAVSPGETHWLQGRNGARFAGTVYGLMQGEEAYRPSATRKKDDGSAIAGGGSHAPGAQAAEYEEYNAVSYGYPLAPRRNLNGVGDTMKVDTAWNCETLAITVKTINANPVGLRWVEFEDGTAVNATIVGSDPPLLAEIAGRTMATVLVKPVDRRRDASGIVDIIDRTGHAAKVLYIYQHDELDITPAGGAPMFGDVEAGDSATANVTFTNNTGHTIHVREAKLQKGIRQFTIASAAPAMPPLALAPGRDLRLVVKARPDARDTLYSDSIICRFGCDSMLVPLRVAAAEPCAAIGDLVFGAFRSGVTPAKTLSLTLSNQGVGAMTFRSPVVTFSDTNFSVAQSEKARLLPPFKLAPGDNTTIGVTFTPPAAPGSYRTVATFLTDATCGRDSSIWSADVVASSSVNAVPGDAEGYRLAVEPRGDAEAVVHYVLPAGMRGSLRVYDGNGEEVPGLATTIEQGGERVAVLNMAGLASGVYYCVMTVSGGRRVAPFVIVR
ncbi:MAG TPA: choice-of-anchor D domain-containing protein, partial [Candidatus Kapabacteria bacterium]|nr:choice-of-anchor D domain-containing protein [Candidatus Kapabacteria bacterium]